MTPQPCPFCGSTDISSGEVLTGYMGNYSKQTSCNDCGATGPEAPVTLEQARGPVGDDLADAEWNRRAALASQAQPVPVAQAIESLVSALAESRGWMRDYSRSIIEAAIEREQPDSFHQAQPSGCAATVPAWQDIATAPRDGRCILITNGDHLENCFWDGAMHRQYPWRNRGGNGWLADWPTHWMPLPPAPGSQADNASPRSDEKESPPPPVDQGEQQ